MNITLCRLSRLERAFYFEKTVSLLEQVSSVYRKYVQKYWRQIASLELGRLTEDILTWPRLMLCAKPPSPDMIPILPLQWYNHVLIYPVWGGDVLIFRLKLPLINARIYNRYQLLLTWPIPYKSRPGYTIHIILDHTDIGIDSVSGDLFSPIHCVGWKPIVCQTGAIYAPNTPSRAHVLITKDKAHTKFCDVQVERGVNRTIISQVTSGKFVLSTWPI